MIGAIIGDIVGSIYEFHNIKTKEFPLFSERCRPTDDSIMTLAVAAALKMPFENMKELSVNAIKCMRKLGRNYPRAGYGGRFAQWLRAEKPMPYGSFGNGAAMRISAVGYAANSMEEVIEYSKAVTRVTHNHAEGIKGAEATAVAIFLARQKKSMAEIEDYICWHYYDIDYKLKDIRDLYEFDVTCKGTVPVALEAFFESTSFEDAIRNAISLGGDSDTLAAIAGAVAEAYYGVPSAIADKALTYLDDTLKEIYKGCIAWNNTIKE